MDKFNFAWLEDTVPWIYADDLLRIKNSCKTPITTGEDVYLATGFKELFEKRAISICHPDPAECGGILEAKKIADLAAQYYALLESRGLTHNKDSLAPMAEGAGKGPLDPFNLISAIYHISGSSAFTLECPHGVLGDKPCHVTLDQIVDIQLSLYEAMMTHELALKGQGK